MAKKKQTRAKEPVGKKTKVLLVDDHPIVRNGLRMLIQHQPDLAVCGEAEDAPEALEIVESKMPDMVVIDLSLKNTSGLDLVKDIKGRYPKIRMLVLSVHDESIYAERVLRAGAAGYIMKKEVATKVVAAIRRVLTGEIYLSEEMSSRMVHMFIGGRSEASGHPIKSLTDRELEVFQLIGRGFKTGEVAKSLKVSVSTVEYHRAHIKEKLQLNDASELMRYAVQWMNGQGAT
ncbi:MAG: response regulator transcription factor [Planctomycetota bacterium]|nr:MAG: response regulator transcription factor [Planctomycetota bacterium]